MTDGSANTISGGTEGKVRTIKRTGDLRVIMAVQGSQTLGPVLQEAWICNEDGRVDWRKVPIRILSVTEYLEAVS